MPRSGLQVSLDKYDAEQRQPWHVHRSPTFFLLLRGDHFDESSSALHEQRALTPLFHPREVPHRGHTGREGMFGVNIELSPEWLADYGLDETELGSLRALEESQARCQTIRLAAFLVASDKVTDEVEDTVFEIVQAFVRERGQAASSPPRWLQRAQDLIAQGYASSISLRSVAKQLALHPVYLARTFRRYFGLSLTEAIQNTRCAAACELMLQGQSAGEAAIAVGFNDQFYFSRLLAQKYGFRPRSVNRISRVFADSFNRA